MTPQAAYKAVKQAAKDFGRSSPQYDAAMEAWAAAVAAHIQARVTTVDETAK